MRSMVAMALALRTRETSCEALIEAHFSRIANRDGKLGAFVTLAEETARRRARGRDRAHRAGQFRGLLDGIPFAAKDVFLTRGLRTTAGSPMFSEWLPERTAVAVHRLEAAGAILIGKTNTHEFAFGITTQTVFASTRNPHDLSRLAGGSSGGSAAAVADGMVPLALGTDTAGSIRLPAAWTGSVGFKPAHGRVSCEGVVAQSYSADHVGPMTRNVVDAALAMAVLADSPAPDYVGTLLDAPALSGITLGVPEPWPEGVIEAEVSAMIRDALGRITHAGGRVVPIQLPLFPLSPHINADIILPETAARHQRYQEEWFGERPVVYGDDVAELLGRGRTIPATALVRASRLRDALRQQIESAFASVSLLATPAVPFVAPLLRTKDVGIDSVHEDMPADAIRFLAAFSLAGLPALSVPIGATTEGLPIGLQLVAARDQEPYLLAAAARLVGEESEIRRLATLL